MQNRSLFFGDNLEILRDRFPGEEGYFDLIYLDPPFNSNRNYNVIFKEGLVDSEAQSHAFEDSWHWTHEAQAQYDYLVTNASAEISELVQAFAKILGRQNDMMAYLTMMTVRLIELHRVLKSTGSLYLHCDPTASHYLKIVLDTIFGKKNYLNEIIWKRSSPTGGKVKSKMFPRDHDSIFWYARGADHFYKNIYLGYSEEYVRKFFTHDDGDGRRYALQTAGDYSQASIKRFKAQNRVHITKNGHVRIKQYLDESRGIIADDMWVDIKNVRQSDTQNMGAKEWLGYPTQKPEALLERIIQASSKEDSWILDPFCGCGTTVSVAERLKRNWVG